MELDLDRTPSINGTTFGQLFIDSTVYCYTLEDEIRDHKIPNETCIPAGRYRITLENSPRFGADTITINDVPDFTGIRMHGGNDKEDTEGCVIVGDTVDRTTGMIWGAQVRGVLKRLKERVRDGLAEGEVFITISNP